MLCFEIVGLEFWFSAFGFGHLAFEESLSHGLLRNLTGLEGWLAPALIEWHPSSGASPPS